MTRKLSRREFLKTALIRTASAITLSCEQTRIPNTISSNRSIVSTTGFSPNVANATQAEILVLGAGISGLAAARTLADKGLMVIVLEARNRIGGRMWTDHSTGSPLDLGASWIEGVKGNPIAALANQFGIKTITSDPENGVVYDFDGRRVSDKEYQQMMVLYDSIYSQVEKMQEDMENDMSLQAAFDLAISRRNLSSKELHNLQFIIQNNFSLELGADPDRLSLWEWDQDEEFPGGEVVFPKGYNQITDRLAAGLDIRTGVTVRSIIYGRQGVEVETTAGVFHGKKAIVSFPLGVLKHGNVKFDPPFPLKKQKAIDRLEMGVLNKVYLKFPEIFWDDKYEEISYNGERTGEWCDWLNLTPYIDEPVLLAFHGGGKGYAIEKLSDDEIKFGAMKTLRVIYGNKIPEPLGLVITRWAKDPFTYGSYSHIPPFASGDDYDALFDPIDDVIYFAGEATNREYPATVHGAYLSGIAAANEITDN